MNIEYPDELKKLILNAKEPLVFKHILKSQILNWSLRDWESVLKDKELEFRSGVFEKTNEPQWERKTKLIKGSFDYFIKQADSKSNWLYFDYKYLSEWFTDVTKLRNDITWAPLGFPEVTVDDCTIWIGSRGAHTPCHVDTYGFNLIHQIYGRKLWIISPPEENLKPTRIPYEESSIYSRLNFFSPSVNEFKGVNNFRKIILNPGEVLYLPHKWWHYVENLETAISVNVWIPSSLDDEERLKESIVQLLVKQMITVSDDETTNGILNPNMDQLVDNNIDNLAKTLFDCKNICKEKLEQNKKIKGDQNRVHDEDSEYCEDEIIERYPFIEKVPKMSQDDFNSFLESQSNRFKESACDSTKCEIGNKLFDIFNALTDADVVDLISKKLLRID